MSPTDISREDLLRIAQPVIVVGIGSSHGDDQAGWSVIDGLARRKSICAQLYKASVPHELLDWLEIDSTLHLIDACLDTKRCVRRFEIEPLENGMLQTVHTDGESKKRSARVLPQLCSSSTHQFELMASLQLAAALSRLPRRVFLWTIAASNQEKDSQLNEQTALLVEECQNRISQELPHA